MYFIWAYALDDIRTSADFSQHSSQGWSAETIVVVPEAPIPTQSPSSSLHLSQAGIVIMTITFTNIFMV